MVDIGSLWEILKITAAVKNAVYEKMVELSRYFGEHDYHLLMDITRFALFVCSIGGVDPKRLNSSLFRKKTIVYRQCYPKRPCC